MIQASGRSFFLLMVLYLWGCTLRPAEHVPNPPQGQDIRFVQFGSRVLVVQIPGETFRFDGAKKVEKRPGGWLVEPEGECVKIFWKGGARSLCLKPVPRVYPHLKILRVDSYALDLKIISLFPKVALFVWEKGKNPDLLHPLEVSPGTHSLRELSLGKTYLFSAAVIFGPDLYGPLSRPFEIEIKDLEPPLPPSGGGYFLKGKALVLVWDPSPSRDVVGYVVERKGKVFKVKQNSFQEQEILKGTVLYNIRAIDGAKHESLPLRIRVVFPGEGENDEEKQARFYPYRTPGGDYYLGVAGRDRYP